MGKRRVVDPNDPWGIARNILAVFGAVFIVYVVYSGLRKLWRRLFPRAIPAAASPHARAASRQQLHQAQQQITDDDADLPPLSPRGSSSSGDSDRAQMGSPAGNRVAESAPLSPTGRAPELDDDAVV